MSLKKHKNRRVVIIAAIWTVISLVFTQYNASFYKETIVKVTAVTVAEVLKPEEEQTQQILAVSQNGADKGKSLTIIAPVSFSEGVSPAYVKGDQLFVDITKDRVTITSVKRDRYVLLMLGLFALIVWWVGQKQGLLSLVSVGLNTVILLLAITLYSHYPQLPLTMIILGTGCLTTLLSLLLGIGWNKKMIATVVATLLASISAWLIGWGVLNYFHDKGLRYEDMQFLTRPYRQIFIASLFLGTLGAAMDIAITVVTTVLELVGKNPQITTKQLLSAGRNVGKNVMGSMASVLLFAYLSGGIPLIILYLKNGWDFMPSVEMTLSLEIARALVGGIGIVLTVPLSVLVVSVLSRKRGG